MRPNLKGDMEMRAHLLLIFLGIFLVIPSIGNTENYPDKSIKLIVPFNPGGGGEQAARLIEKEFKEQTGQPLSFIYKPGGTGLIGMSELSRQKPDGYTIAVHSYPLLVIDSMTGRANYTLDNFDLLALLCLEEVYLAVKQDSPFNNGAELIEYAIKNPGKVNLGICEIMGPTHIPALRLKKAGVPFNHVSIDGAGKVAPALLGGQVDAAIVPSGGISGSVGKMKILGTFSPERSKKFPNAPTMKELGYDINSQAGRYMAAPHGVDPDKRKFLEDSLKAILQRTDVQAKFENAGTVPVFRNGEQLRRMFDNYQKENQALIDEYKSQKK